MRKIDVLKRSVVGVCAATLLTGLCVAPAFAAGSVDASAAVDKANGTGNTTVQVKSEVANITATVPTKITVSIAPNGTMTFPASTDFKITAGGNDNWPLKVASLGVTMEGSYKLATTDAFTEQDSNVYMTLNNGTSDVALASDASTNGEAVKTFVQKVSGSTDWGLTMNGKVKGAKYSTTAATVATLNWTISVA